MLNDKLSTKGKELEGLQLRHAEELRTMNKQQKNVERYLAKRQLLISRKDEADKHIRNLGVLPEEAYERHSMGIKSEKVSGRAGACKESV